MYSFLYLYLIIGLTILIEYVIINVVLDGGQIV